MLVCCLACNQRGSFDKFLGVPPNISKLFHGSHPIGSTPTGARHLPTPGGWRHLNDMADVSAQEAADVQRAAIRDIEDLSKAAAEDTKKALCFAHDVLKEQDSKHHGRRP